MSAGKIILGVMGIGAAVYGLGWLQRQQELADYVSIYAKPDGKIKIKSPTQVEIAPELIIDNRTQLSFKVTSADFKVFLGSNQVATIKNLLDVKIEKTSQAVIPLSVIVNPLSLIGELQTLFQEDIVNNFLNETLVIQGNVKIFNFIFYYSKPVTLSYSLASFIRQ